MSEEKKVKILHIYKSEPNDTVKKLVEILNRDRDSEEIKLYVNEPNYDLLVEKLFEADKSVCWW